ncbi:MAG: SPASM domain-containing protein [Bacteroidia bacterium]|nr:SPASM domain-containing protein [Bacteroidia bacterium]MCZ2278473.1 SPASM domain-containing protein [Bacteroidia bacterium]
MNRSFKDGLNLASKLTFRRTWNAVKIISSYLVSKYVHKPIHWGMPVSIAFEPTTSCNLRCPECPSGLRSFTRATGMLEPEFFRKQIDELAGDLIYLTFYFQGEPYLNKHFLEMVAYASSKGIYTATSTNAHFLNDETAKKTVESGMDRLVISIDGTSQEVYQQYRVGGNLQKVLDGARNVIRWKKELRSKTPYIIFQFLVVRHNEHQVEEVKQMAKEFGADEVALKTAQIYDYEKGSDLIPVNEKYSRYKKSDNCSYSIKSKLLNHCWKMWHSCVVTWDGHIVPCCFDKDAKYKMGDLKKNTFREVWNNERYNRFRASVLRSRSEIDMCRNCTEGTRLWA